MTMPSVCDSTIVQFNDMSVAVNSTISNWFWDFGDGNTSTSQNPLHNYLAAGAYNVQLVVNSSTGKTDTFLMVVTIVNNAMTVNAIANPSAVCLGDSVVLSASGASVYSWSGGVINNTPFVPLVSTIYSVTGTNAYGCTQTTTVLVTVHALPVVSISSVPNNTTVCAGNSITLSGSGALTYSWSGGISNGVNFTPSSGNTYTVVGTDANGCTNTSSISIQVNPLPVVTATASDNIICLGESLVLSGSGAVSYSWSGGVINGTPISPSASSVYTVTGTDANGCTGTSSVSITVNPLPNVTAVALPDIICSGNSSTLTATGANQYSWSGGVTNGVSFIPAATSTYTVTGVDMNGCSNTATVGITVNNTLNVTISPANPILCIGDDIQLLASGASSYNWMPNTAISSTTIADPIVSPTSTTTYTVTGSDAFGCTGSATITIEVIADPSVTVSKSGDIECGITSVQLSASGGNTFSWEPSWLVTNPASAFTYTNITEPTTFTVTATIGSCTVSDTIRVNVFNNDEAAIFIPNAFSPNGDGLNDCLTIRHKAKFSSYYFAIFNRWGQRVFEADVPEYCWDGQFQNEDAPFGSYYYFLRAETSCGKILKKGDISLIR
jgi:gliding motility-associated-like protein